MKKLLVLLTLLLLPITASAAGLNLIQGGTGWNTSTAGDLLVGTSSSLRYTRLPIGSEGSCLGVTSGVLGYKACGSGSGGNPFNQWLDSTSSPTFLGVTSTATSTLSRLIVDSGYSPGTAQYNLQVGGSGAFSGSLFVGDYFSVTRDSLFSGNINVSGTSTLATTTFSFFDGQVNNGMFGYNIPVGSFAHSYFPNSRTVLTDISSFKDVAFIWNTRPSTPPTLAFGSYDSNMIAQMVYDTSTNGLGFIAIQPNGDLSNLNQFKINATTTLISNDLFVNGTSTLAATTMFFDDEKNTGFNINSLNSPLGAMPSISPIMFKNSGVLNVGAWIGGLLVSETEANQTYNYSGNPVIFLMSKDFSSQFSINYNTTTKKVNFNIENIYGYKPVYDFNTEVNVQGTTTAQRFCFNSNPNSCVTSWASGGGNPFNQWLDTTSTPSFTQLTLNGGAGIGYCSGTVTQHQCDGSQNILYSDPNYNTCKNYCQLYSVTTCIADDPDYDVYCASLNPDTTNNCLNVANGGNNTDAQSLHCLYSGDYYSCFENGDTVNCSNVTNMSDCNYFGCDWNDNTGTLLVHGTSTLATTTMTFDSKIGSDTSYMTVEPFDLYGLVPTTPVPMIKFHAGGLPFGEQYGGIADVLIIAQQKTEDINYPGPQIILMPRTFTGDDVPNISYNVSSDDLSMSGAKELKIQMPINVSSTTAKSYIYGGLELWNSLRSNGNNSFATSTFYGSNILGTDNTRIGTYNFGPYNWPSIEFNDSNALLGSSHVGFMRDTLGLYGVEYYPSLMFADPGHNFVSIQYNTTTNKLSFVSAGETTYSFSNNVDINGSATTTGHFQVTNDTVLATTTLSGPLYYNDTRGYPNNLSLLTTHLDEENTNTLLDKSRSTLSCTGGVLTYNLVALNGAGTFNFNGITYPVTVGSASVNLLSGTNAVPVTNFVYFHLVANVPTLTTSATEPTDTHIDVAEFIVGAVSGTNYTVYGYNRNRTEIDSFVNRVISRFEDMGTFYDDGFIPTVYPAGISIFSSAASPSHFYEGIFSMFVDQTLSATSSFTYVDNTGFHTSTNIADLAHYSDGTAMTNNERANVVWGIVATSTTAGGVNPTSPRLYAVLQTKPNSVYNTDATAIEDLYEATNYYPPTPELKEIFTPVVRTIIHKQTNKFIAFSSGNYFKDLRGKITSGGGAATPVDLSGYAKLASENVFTTSNTFLSINASSTSNFLNINAYGGATTTNSIHTPELCLTNDCRTVWPSSTGGTSNWQAMSWGTDLTPTSTSAGIFVNSSSTFNSTLRVNGTLTGVGSISAGTTVSAGTYFGANSSSFLIGSGTVGNSGSHLNSINGSYTGALYARGSSLTAIANNSFSIADIAGNSITEAGSGSHPLIASLAIETPTVNNNSATVTSTASLYIQGAMSATVAEKNYAMWIDDGPSRFDGAVGIGTTTPGTWFGTEKLSVIGDSYLGGNATTTGRFTIGATNPTVNSNFYSAVTSGNNFAGYFNGNTYTSGNSTTTGSMVVGNGTLYPDGYHGIFVSTNETSAGTFGITYGLNASTTNAGSLGFAVGIKGKASATNIGAGAYGVYGEATNDVATFNYGVYGLAQYSANTNYGVYGSASYAGITNYGVYGKATTASTNNIGVYGEASGGTNNYAGYFLGNVKTTGNSTTTGNVVIGDDATAGTKKGCLAIMSGDGSYLYCYASKSSSSALTCGATTCSGSATSTMIIGQ